MAKKKQSKFVPRVSKYSKYRKRKSTRDFDDARYKKWRREVRSRDGYKCKWPGCSKKKVYCHHIMRWANYPTLRYVVSNGICLCYVHHKQVTGKEEQYAAFLFSLLR